VGRSNGFPPEIPLQAGRKDKILQLVLGDKDIIEYRLGAFRRDE